MYGIQSHTKKQHTTHNTLPFLSFPFISFLNAKLILKQNAIFPLPMFPLPSGPTTSLYCPTSSPSDINTTKYLQHHNHWHLFSDTITSHSRFILLYLWYLCINVTLQCVTLHTSLCQCFTLIGQISWLSCMKSWWARKAKINAKQSRDTHPYFSNLLLHH